MKQSSFSLLEELIERIGERRTQKELTWLLEEQNEAESGREFTVATVAAKLRIQPRRVRRWIKRQEIKAIRRPNKTYRIPADQWQECENLASLYQRKNCNNTNESDV